MAKQSRWGMTKNAHFTQNTDSEIHVYAMHTPRVGMDILYSGTNITDRMGKCM